MEPITFKILRGTPERWAQENPILERGEPGLEIDPLTGDQKLKVGDGTTRYGDLPYFTTQEVVQAMIEEALSGIGEGGGSGLLTHINSSTPHPVYDDGPSFNLLYQNAKV